MSAKKYILKPGKHQFAPGSPAVHCNDNLSDDEAKWYLENYPHIVSLFIKIPEAKKQKNKKTTKSFLKGQITNSLTQ